MNKIWFSITAVFAALVFTSTAPAKDPARPKIITNSFGKVLVKPNGQPMRGHSISIRKWRYDRGDLDYLDDDAYWQRLTEGGLDAVRIAYFDPWAEANGKAGTHTPWPHANLYKKEDRLFVLGKMDRLVEKAAQHGMHVLINYHNTGGYRDPDYSKPAGKDNKFEYLDTMDNVMFFWNLIAPRYADRTHVFYEPLNEYVRWRPDNFTDKDYRDTAYLFNLIRKHAPETHICLVSNSNHVPAKPKAGHSLLNVARHLRDQYQVDFSNASVGFHPYNPKPETPNPSKYIKELMKEFAVINTEQNFPIKMTDEKTNQWLDASGLEGDLMGVQSMEKMGISWFHWNIQTPEELEKRWFGMVVKDAKEKGYWWRE